MAERRARGRTPRPQRLRLAIGVALLAPGLARAQAGGPGAGSGAAPSRTELAAWFQRAAEMRARAESWGDQSYGAVLALAGSVVGDGPSRVVQRGDPSAHAEREAIRDAQRRLGRTLLAGATLVSTSRPCPACEAAAAEAGVERMVFGPDLVDAGRPRRGTR